MLSLPPGTEPAPASAAATVSAWTPERVARAVQLYIGEGLTAAEVADALGEAFTRGAVIGKMHRLGVGKRELRGGGLCVRPPVQRTPRRPDQRPPPSPPPKPLPPLREVGPTGAPKRLAELDCVRLAAGRSTIPAPALCIWRCSAPAPRTPVPTAPPTPRSPSVPKSV